VISVGAVDGHREATKISDDMPARVILDHEPGSGAATFGKTWPLALAELKQWQANRRPAPVVVEPRDARLRMPHKAEVSFQVTQ
jgi:hypothetical protein